jgi:hypothetical protein
MNSIQSVRASTYHNVLRQLKKHIPCIPLGASLITDVYGTLKSPISTILDANIIYSIYDSLFDEFS